MKTRLLISILTLIGFISQAQTKTFTGTLESYDCGDCRCGFAIKNASGDYYEESINLVFEDQNKLKLSGEFQDIVVGNSCNETLNPKYKGKKVVITCYLKNEMCDGGDGEYPCKKYYVTKIEFVLVKVGQ